MTGDERFGAQYRQAEVRLAREVLTEFTLDQANRTARAVGFTSKPTPDAPSRYDVLQAAVRHSTETGEPLPISSEHNESVIYTTPEANIAFRFVHDVNHVRRQLSFQLVDELELALWHLQELEGAGFPPTSVPWRLLHADLIGQAQLMSLTRRFPLDQQRFVNSCLVDGFEQGLIIEARLDLPDEHVG
jgi:hypothetical protein